jgi:hypothetical protein
MYAIHPELVAGEPFRTKPPRRTRCRLKLRQYMSLAFEARQPFGVLCEFGGEHLDGDIAPQFGIRGAIDLA